MKNKTQLLLVGVDGLDFDVVLGLGEAVLPNLAPLVRASTPHTATFPPDSVPSWTSILTGQRPHEHGQLHSVNYLIDTGGRSEAGLSGMEDQCFWHAAPAGARIAVLNPFLAYPPFAPSATGAMVSAPSFAEDVPLIVDPTGSLVSSPPDRMGGFAYIPSQRHLERFAEETAGVARGQFEYALKQIDAGRWDLVFTTNLTVDRMQHSAWRHFDATDPTHPGPSLAHLVPESYRQLDQFIGAARAACASDHRIAIFSDHGHGQRASIGVNFHELLRRAGLFAIPVSPPGRRAVEIVKTSILSYATACHAEDAVLWLAKRTPGKASLKSGSFAGRPEPGSVVVPDLAGTNPYGGIITGGDDAVTVQVLALFDQLTHEGTRVVRWVRPAEEVVGAGGRGSIYPDLLFELDPRFGPTWNLYGPIFAPILTHKRISGGHTRRGVFATNTPHEVAAPRDSVEVHAALRSLCRTL